jgi:hypothetical protein
MLLTGQPLVDLGLAVAALDARKRSISDVTEADLQNAVRRLNMQIDPSKTSKGPVNALIQLSAYWQNNPLAGKNPNIAEYRCVLDQLLSDAPKTYKGYCQVCGRSGVYIDANRSWLPLGAGADSDPCSFPNLKGKSLCVNCFCAVLLVPLGCKFVNGNPYFFHLTDPQLICRAAEEAYFTIQNQLASKQQGDVGLQANVRLTGRVALLEIVSGSRWDGLQNPAFLRRCPTGATIIAFSNDGAGATWQQLHLPAQALEFFHEMNVVAQDHPGQFRSIFVKWAQRCEKPEFMDKATKVKHSNPLFNRLCDDIEQRRSLAFLVRAIVRSRKPTEQTLKQEKKKVLELYEQIVLNKPERFALLEKIADSIIALDERYRRPLLRRLANTRSKDSLYSILVQYTHEDKANLRLSRNELRMIDSEQTSEIISLLYLLCVAEK